MKTAQIMRRKLIGQEVRQNHKTEMLNANDLHKIGNELRSRANLSKKQMASYFNLDSTDELIKDVCIVDNLKIEEVKKSTRGKSGGTWVHPIVFIDMAMWYSPELKVRILKWVQDGLLMARDNSGESFKQMSKALNAAFPKEMQNPMRYKEISNLIAMSCRVGEGKDRWQRATEEQLKKRDKIQNNVIVIADLCANVGTCISKAIAKAK